MPIPRKLKPAGTLGRTVAAILRERGWSYYQLAKTAGLDESQVGRILAGQRQPTWDTACKIADALDVSLDTLRGRGDSEKSVLAT